MTLKTFLISTAIAISFSAVPAHAQFGSGTSYDTPRQTQPTKAERKAAKKLKKLEEARAKKEAMEREFKAKEQMAQQDEMKSYGSGTSEDAMMKKDDAMMAKDDAMMKKDEMTSYGLDTSEHGMMKKDDMMTKKDGGMMKKDSMMSSDAMAPMGKPTNCPQGTTPQDNGTCLLTSGSLPIN